MTEAMSVNRTDAVGRLTVADFAERSLRDMVLRGDVKPGSRLNEVAIAEELGISRGPLREAIQRLAGDGLLEHRPHRGAFVALVSEDELRQLYEVRIAIETFAVRKVAGSRDEVAKQALTNLLVQTRAELHERDAYPAELDFHQQLLGLADNDALLKVGHDLQIRVSLARARSAAQSHRARAALLEHEAIAEAVCEHARERAVKLLGDHLWRSFESAVSVLRRDAGEDA